MQTRRVICRGQQTFRNRCGGWEAVETFSDPLNEIVRFRAMTMWRTWQEMFGTEGEEEGKRFFWGFDFDINGFLSQLKENNKIV